MWLSWKERRHIGRRCFWVRDRLTNYLPQISSHRPLGEFQGSLQCSSCLSNQIRFSVHSTSNHTIRVCVNIFIDTIKLWSLHTHAYNRKRHHICLSLVLSSRRSPFTYCITSRLSSLHFFHAPRYLVCIDHNNTSHMESSILIAKYSSNALQDHSSSIRTTMWVWERAKHSVFIVCLHALSLNNWAPLWVTGLNNIHSFIR